MLPPLETTGLVPVTLVTVPPLDGLVLVIVKLGYVPLVDIPVPAVKTTVWSGAVLVMFNVPLVVIGLPVMEIPVPAVAATLVTVPTETDPPNAVALPLIVMLELANCALDTVPDRSVVGMVLDAVNALVPLPLTWIQCDRICRIFVQYLAILNNEN